MQHVCLHVNVLPELLVPTVALVFSQPHWLLNTFANTLVPTCNGVKQPPKSGE